MKDLKKEAQRWFAQAKSDYSVLGTIYKVEKYDLVCFLSQQIAEKTLKAFLYHNGEEIIFTHSIFKLCEQASNYDISFKDLKNKLKTLDYYYVESRYPNSMEDIIPAEFFNEEDAKEAISMAELAINHVNSLINQR